MNEINHLIHYDIFAPFHNLLAFSTTKETFDVPFPRFTGDHAGIYQNNRDKLAQLLNVPSSRLVFPRQTHTRCIAVLHEIPEQELKETDALVTNSPDICLCVQTADCVPVLLFDPIESAIAAVHAGWRGTVNKIAEVAVQSMYTAYGSKPENILALIGPSIGPGNYEVGNEVVYLAKNNLPDAQKTIRINDNGKYHFNLWEANRQILLRCGLPSRNIQISGECSYQENKKYYSARREGPETGRMVSGIMLRK